MTQRPLPEAYVDVDLDGMWTHLVSFADHWRETVKLTTDVDWRIDPERIDRICLAGMGGSAIGADLIRSYAAPSSRRPVHVNRSYTVPGWVGESTLFVACSYSGNTEETLSALAEAKERGAQIVAVTSGGELLLQASKEGFGYVRIPGGLPPRAALAYSFVPLFRLFSELGELPEGDEVLDVTADQLERQSELLSDPAHSQARTLALDLRDTLPIIYTGPDLLESVGVRWRCQFEENAKTLAYGNTIPEMNHNEVVGWEQVAHLTGRLSMIQLEDEQDHPKVVQRARIVREMLDDRVVHSTLLASAGPNRLARQFSLIQLGDWVSYYLAVEQGVDPTPIAPIDLLKSRLSDN
ncbi:MAG: bifunctional phosphoglucose/phosphomannose isomerase [Bacteroidota bacterium]